MYHTVTQEGLPGFGRVWVSCQYFPVLDYHTVISYNDFLTLDKVRVRSQYFPILDCISYSYAGRTSWFSLGLGLVVCLNFPVLDCISYGCYARWTPWLS